MVPLTKHSQHHQFQVTSSSPPSIHTIAMATLGLPTSSMVSGSTYVMPNPGQRVILSGNRANVSQVQRPQGSGVSIRWGSCVDSSKAVESLKFLNSRLSSDVLKVNYVLILKITMVKSTSTSGTCIIFLYFSFYDKLSSENYCFHFIGRDPAEIAVGHGPTVSETSPCTWSCPPAASFKNTSVIPSCHPHQSFHKYHQLFSIYCP